MLVKIVTILIVPNIGCDTWCTQGQQNIGPGFLSTQQIHPIRTRAFHGNWTCLLFQLHDILFRGSYPALSSFHCYPFMTAPARPATDVCYPSPAEINCFTQAQLCGSTAQTQMWNCKVRCEQLKGLQKMKYSII